jgi:hypothetical protein
MFGKLYVSGSALSSCDEVVRVMRELKITGHVIPNTTVTSNGIEKGCNILVSSQPPKVHMKSLWFRLQNELNFKCAHCVVGHAESGCALDVFRKSLCISDATEGLSWP